MDRSAQRDDADVKESSGYTGLRRRKGDHEFSAKQLLPFAYESRIVTRTLGTQRHETFPNKQLVTNEEDVVKERAKRARSAVPRIPFCT